MNKLRQWINRDDGRWFQIGNENLNTLQIIGYVFMVLGFLLFAVRQHLSPNIPTWIPCVALLMGFCGLYFGEPKEKK